MAYKPSVAIRHVARKLRSKKTGYKNPPEKDKPSGSSQNI
jgi:hypothetical protein